jgi:hypothetical protein
VRKLKKARRTSCCSRSAEEATCQRPGSATPDSQLHYSLTYRYLSNKELKKSKWRNLNKKTEGEDQETKSNPTTGTFQPSRIQDLPVL